MTAFTVSEEELGTPEDAWAASPRLASCPPLACPAPVRVVVVAPHPDDEVLAVGGWMRALARAGCAIEVVAVTDGEASHPGPADQLVETRAGERAEALIRLGVDAAVTRLRCPDGAVSREVDLDRRLEPLVAGASLVLAPWDHDGHPDHDATGAAARAACLATGTPAFSYPVWAWHWARPDSDDLPWSRARRIPLEPAAREAKAAAVAAFRSQTEAQRGVTILPAAVLVRFLRPFEVVFL